MSIALSAVVRPSRLLRHTLLLLALAHGALALAIGAGMAPPLAWPGAVAAACLLCAVLATHAALRRGTAHQIDVSGLGELRVTVQHHSGAAVYGPVVMHLLPGSTVWPQLLVLLLRPAPRGRVLALPVLPDSVPPEQFRALAVACRSIARRDNKFAETNKIV